jgi:hypothetical protein
MSTGQLHHGTARLRQMAAKSRGRTPKANLETIFLTPVPAFNQVYATPPSFGKLHPIYAMHRGANRIYNDRLKMYGLKAGEFSAEDLIAYIRQDIVSNLLAVERVGFGPFALDRYRFLSGMGLHAWRAPHRVQAEMLLREFQKHYRKRKERPSVHANNDSWGARGHQGQSGAVD